MSIYEKLQQEYPNKEIKMISKQFLKQYESYGFKSIYEWEEKSLVTNKDIGKYCFIIQ